MKGRTRRKIKNFIKKIRLILKPKMIVVVDTNLFVASNWNDESASSKIISLIESGELTLIYTNSIKREVFHILKNIKASKKHLKFVENIFENACLITVKEHFDAVKDDPHDNKFVDCAVAGGAKYIISNDKDLLTLGSYKSVAIVKPTDFIAAL